MRGSTYSLSQLSSRLVELFPKLTMAISRYESNSLAMGLISLPQYWAMAVINENRSCTMSELANSLNLQCSSVSGLVDRLIKQNLVKRLRSDKDRRVVRVTLSSKGRNLLRDIAKEKRRGIAELFRPLTEVERRQYLSIIEKLVRELSRR